MNQVFIGIDPGKTGALAVISDTMAFGVWDWPGHPAAAAAMVENLLDSAPLATWFAAIEEVWAAPVQGRTQGAQGMFNFGTNYGVWQGILAAHKVKTLLVRPQTWQKDYKAPGAGKDVLITVARKMFPQAPLSRKKDHGRADALLIADWCRRQHIMPSQEAA